MCLPLWEPFLGLILSLIIHAEGSKLHVCNPMRMPVLPSRELKLSVQQPMKPAKNHTSEF